MPAFLRSVLSTLYRLPRLALIGVVRAYQLLLSPHFPSSCRYHPTCSSYAVEAFRRHGAVKGLVLTIHRLGRCHPWGGHGVDPPRWPPYWLDDTQPPPGDPEALQDD
jgi:hypothetical protein